MNRRNFLQGHSSPDKIRNSTSGNRTIPLSSAGLEEYSGVWGFEQAAHLLRRTTFNSRRKDVEMLKQKSMSLAVDYLLADSPLPQPPLVFFQNDNAKQGETWVNSQFNSVTDNSRLESLAGWWVNLMRDTTTAAREKMVLFLNNHFVSTASGVKDSRLLYKQNSLIREMAFGNFKDLAKKITLDPGMLRFLNGNTNTKQDTNENYGRELQELFTIGKGKEITKGNYTTYTESDVQAAARVLTGWSDDSDKQTYAFSDRNHDTTDKQFSSNYGSVIIKGRTGIDGAMSELDDLINMIFNQEATSKNICRELYKWYVDYIIDETIEENVIKPMATILRSNNYNVKPALLALLKSAHFFDSSRFGSMIKPPIDFVLSTFNTLLASLPKPTSVTDLVRVYYGAIGQRRLLNSLQQTLFGQLNVAGWEAYHQEPDYYEFWINTDTLQKRVKYLNELAVLGYQSPESRELAYADVFALAEETSDPSDPNKLVNEWVMLLFAFKVSSEFKDMLKGVLLNNLPDYEWTVEWLDYKSSPTDANKKTAIEKKLRALLKQILVSPEFQLM
ncbi:MAG: DUF1800 domain-containing protein [Chlorobiota bacterium]|nr:DUF1800 domain-containing protein [Chlorobiota bacterium]QQS65934.1 MAG: DUF1800 domain-containing protein [Chlorobiota bacterium]